MEADSQELINISEALTSRLTSLEARSWIKEQAAPYRELMAYYQCAMMEIETRFKIMEHLKNSLIRMELNKLKNLRRRKDFRQLEEQIKETPKGKERHALYKRRQEILKETGMQ